MQSSKPATSAESCLQAEAENDESELDVNDSETKNPSDPSISQ